MSKWSLIFVITFSRSSRSWKLWTYQSSSLNVSLILMFPLKSKKQILLLLLTISLALLSSSDLYFMREGLILRFLFLSYCCYFLLVLKAYREAMCKQNIGIMFCWALPFSSRDTFPTRWLLSSLKSSSSSSIPTFL